MDLHDSSMSELLCRASSAFEKVAGWFLRFRTFTRHTSIIGGRNSSGSCLPKSTPPKAVYTTVTMAGKARMKIW